MIELFAGAGILFIGVLTGYALSSPKKETKDEDARN